MILAVLYRTPISDFRKKFGNVIVCAMERDHQPMIPSGDVITEAALDATEPRLAVPIVTVGDDRLNTQSED